MRSRNTKHEWNSTSDLLHIRNTFTCPSMSIHRENKVLSALVCESHQKDGMQGCRDAGMLRNNGPAHGRSPHWHDTPYTCHVERKTKPCSTHMLSCIRGKAADARRLTHSCACSFIPAEELNSSSMTSISNAYCAYVIQLVQYPVMRKESSHDLCETPELHYKHLQCSILIMQRCTNITKKRNVCVDSHLLPTAHWMKATAHDAQCFSAQLRRRKSAAAQTQEHSIKSTSNPWLKRRVRSEWSHGNCSSS